MKEDEILWMGQRNPAPVENGGNTHPLFIGVQPSVMQDLATILSMLGFFPWPCLVRG